MKENFRDDIFRVTLDGKCMQTQDDMFTEFAKKLRFPDYFGYNWPALDECICDLDWIEQDNIEITIVNKDLILLKDPYNKLHVFYEILEDTKKYWTEDKTKKFNITIK